MIALPTAPTMADGESAIKLRKWRNGGEGKQTKKKLITEIVRINYRASLSALAESTQFSIRQSSAFTAVIQIVQFMDLSLFIFVILPFSLFAFRFRFPRAGKRTAPVRDSRRKIPRVHLSN